MPKDRTRKRPRTIMIEEFDRDLPRVLAAARKAGGVLVVDNEGGPRFHVSIPHIALPESRR